MNIYNNLKKIIPPQFGDTILSNAISSKIKALTRLADANIKLSLGTNAFNISIARPTCSCAFSKFPELYSRTYNAYAKSSCCIAKWKLRGPNIACLMSNACYKN